MKKNSSHKLSLKEHEEELLSQAPSKANMKNNCLPQLLHDHTDSTGPGWALQAARAPSLPWRARPQRQPGDDSQGRPWLQGFSTEFVEG